MILKEKIICKSLTLFSPKKILITSIDEILKAADSSKNRFSNQFKSNKCRPIRN